MSTGNSTTDKRRTTQKTGVVSSMGKMPPQATELEEAVLGALMLERDALLTIHNILKPHHFYKDAHQRIMQAIIELYDKSSPVDILTVTNHLRSEGELERVGGAYYITSLTDSVASAANIEFHARIIIQKWMARENIVVGTEMVNDGYDDTIDVLDLLQKSSDKINKIIEGVIVGNEKSAREMALEAANKRGKVSSDLLGLSWGSTALDKATNGLIGGNLYILAARPAMGKTTMVLNIVHDIIVRQKEPIGVFSLEMTYSDLYRKLQSIESDIDGNLIKRNSLSPEEQKRLLDADGVLGDTGLRIDDTAAATISYIRTRSAIMKRKYGIKGIIIDYLQLMSGESNDKTGKNREQEISQISRGLKLIAKELNIPVIALSQLSRAVESRQDKQPQLSDLRESGSIEQDADMVMFLWRPEYYNLYQDIGVDFDYYNLKGVSTDGLVAVIIAKQRDGATFSVPMKCDLAKSQIKDHSDIYGQFNAPFPSENHEPYKMKPSTRDWTQSVKSEEEDQLPF